MKKRTGKNSSITTGVVSVFLAAAPGTQATTTSATDSELTRAVTPSAAAVETIASKAEDINNVKVAATTKPTVQPVFSRRTVFARGGPPTFVKKVKK